MKKILSILSILLVFSLLLGSCGDVVDNSTKDTTKEPTSTSEQETTTIQEEITTIKEEETGDITTKEDITTSPEQETTTGEPTTSEQETTTKEIETTTKKEEVTTTKKVTKQSVKNGVLFNYSPANCVSSNVAKELVELCSKDDRANTLQWFKDNGFTYVDEGHYNKVSTSLADTSAWMLAKKTVTFGNAQKTLYVLTARETTDYEWYRNVDVYQNTAVSHIYADNFYNSAKDIFDSVKPTFEKDPNALIIVCGHSRGAAVANILGVLLVDWKGSTNGIWAYCNACPNTVRLSFPSENYPNIYNFINPSDPVTYLPLTSMGYKRAGVDYTLSQTSSVQEKLDNIVSLCSQICTSVDKYYNYKFSLTGAGEDKDNGVTLYEIMRLAADYLIDGEVTEVSVPIDDVTKISPQSELAPLLSYALTLQQDALTLGNQHNYNTYLTKIGAWGASTRK